MNKEEMFALHKEIREEMYSQWDRVLPFCENFTNRWEKAKFLGFGEGTSVYDSSVIMGKVKVAENTWIGPFTILDGTGGGIEIGCNCSISAGVQIYTHDTVKRSLSGNRADPEFGGVSIGDDCYVGPMCIISRNVHIGNRSVICANSFVNSSCPENGIMAGNPAKIIGKVEFDETDNPILKYF